MPDPSTPTPTPSPAMKIQPTANGSVTIYLDGNEIATAIDAYLVSQRVYVSGPRTITANGTILEDVKGEVFVEGTVISDKDWSPRFHEHDQLNSVEKRIVRHVIFVGAGGGGGMGGMGGGGGGWVTNGSHSGGSSAGAAASLVVRVANAMYDVPHDSEAEARAAIREVVAWLRENPGPNSAWSAVARDLRDEADR